jgi:hypothetical protein
MDTRSKVGELLNRGLTVSEVAEVLGLARSTVCYHKRLLGMRMERRFARRFDWERIQAHYDAGHSMRECQKVFGFSKWARHQAVSRGAIVPRARTTPLTELLVADRRRARSHVKGRLLAAGLKENRCERCSISAWLGEPLSLALHHINGDGHDNRLENLQLLCPNCHSQTPNFGVKNWKRRADPS